MPRVDFGVSHFECSGVSRVALRLVVETATTSRAYDVVRQARRCRRSPHRHPGPQPHWLDEEATTRFQGDHAVAPVC